MHQMAAAIASSLAGTVASGVGFLLAQTPGGADNLAPYVSGGGAAAAVAGLVYIAKKLASGELVAVPIANVMKQQEDRERKLSELLEDGKEREDVYKSFLLHKGML